MKKNLLKQTLLRSIISAGLIYSFNSAFGQDKPQTVSEANDFPIHTTIFHNPQGKTLTFQVTFIVGFYDAKTKSCIMQKKREFQSTHKDGSHALLYGKHLTNEYEHGPKLYNCAQETLHIIGNDHPDVTMMYQLENNGKYYTSAIPNVHNIYPH